MKNKLALIVVTMNSFVQAMELSNNKEEIVIDLSHIEDPNQIREELNKLEKDNLSGNIRFSNKMLEDNRPFADIQLTSAIINSDKKSVENYLNDHFSSSNSDLNSAILLSKQVYEARIQKNSELFTRKRGKRLLVAGAFGTLTILALFTTGDNSFGLQLPSLLIPIVGTGFYCVEALSNRGTKQYEAEKIWEMISTKNRQNNQN